MGVSRARKPRRCWRTRTSWSRRSSPTKTKTRTESSHTKNFPVQNTTNCRGSTSKTLFQDFELCTLLLKILRRKYMKFELISAQMQIEDDNFVLTKNFLMY